VCSSDLNVELGKRILKESGLAIVSADTMADGAEKAVALAKNRS
jgi:succinyl-CoA synthetase beta subunit